MARQSKRTKALTFKVKESEMVMLDYCIKEHAKDNIGEISRRDYFMYLLNQDYMRLTSNKEVISND